MKKDKNNQSIRNTTDKLVRHYKVPFRTQKEDVLNTVLSRIDQQEKLQAKPKQRDLTWFRTGIAVAASIVLALVFWFFTASVELTAGQNQTAAYRLPDNSRVVLHENSTISYRRYNWNRKVKMNGSVYYEVQKGSGFTVTSPNGKVEVLGTRFLVSDARENIDVLCYEGKVKTTVDENEWILEQGDRFDGQKKEVDAFSSEGSAYPSFARFQKSYRNAALSEVVMDIQQFFNVQISLENNINKSFSGTFQTGNLDMVMQIVSESLQLEYEFTDTNKIKITN